MSKRALTPPGMGSNRHDLHLSAGILSHDHVFVTGMTGSDATGHMPQDAATQFQNAFSKIAEVLAEAGLTLGDVVEMTSYHINMADTFDTFDAIRRRCMPDTPPPAWTAVEVAGLRRASALVEIRVIAQVRAKHTPI